MKSLPMGIMIYWRFKRENPGIWNPGYTTRMNNNLVRMGRWNGDTSGGAVVDEYEIEWRHL